MLSIPSKKRFDEEAVTSRLRHPLFLLVLTVGWGCGDEVMAVGDAGLSDGGVRDTGVEDGGFDSGVRDGGEASDAGPDGAVDGATSDGSAADAGSDAGCTVCHGDTTSPAPPSSVGGGTETSLRGVGAHRSHLRAIPSRMFRAVACTDCHRVPTTVDAEGHMDTELPAELTFSDLATADGALAPSFDGDTCSDAYCHGATLSGGSNTTPVWTTVGGSQVACGTCHGLPPDAPHVSSTRCYECHPSINASFGFPDASLHVNGIVELAVTCTSCHGSTTNAAPPRDTTGSSSTADRGVGAHQSHLGTSTWRRAITCDACHTVPGGVLAAGHIDTVLPAELSWGGLSGVDEAAPSFDGTRCSNVYCHGATLLPGGTNTAPEWTVVDGSQAACGTCHGLPPSGSHPAAGTCSDCHPTVDASLAIIDADRHIDGIVDLTGLTCTSCHGMGSDPAPPVDTSGLSATTARGVGAHQSHLGSSDWRADIDCTECHDVPLTTGATGHIDASRPADLAFGPRAGADGASPTFDGATCAYVYCHGATLLPGGSNTTPAWTTVDGTQAACGTCHSLPPEGSHTSSDLCSTCHPTVDSGGAIVEPTLHINGVVDLLAVSCTSCHGSGTDPAPPSDVAGGTSTDLRGVGAHQSHLRSSDWRAPMVCSECHQVPSTVDAAGHLDGTRPADLRFGPRAAADGASPAFDGSTCSDVYCHGATLVSGGTITEPAWTTVDGTQAACGACHGLPPGGAHPDLAACELCHGEVIDAGGAITSAALHVDGIVQVASYHVAGWADPTAHGTTVNDVGFASCQGCHGDALDGGDVGVSCASCHADWETDCTFCHGGVDDTSGAPPGAVDGLTTRGHLSVGAHQEHVQATSMHVGWACSLCHVEPTDVFSAGHIDGDGRAEVTFDALNPSAAYDGATGRCSNLYCHGDGNGALGSGVWSANLTFDCGSCHVPFTGATEPELESMSGEHKKHVRDEGQSCDTCHATTVDSSGDIVRIDLHVDGSFDVSLPSWDPSGAGTCTPSCHEEKDWR